MVEHPRQGLLLNSQLAQLSPKILMVLKKQVKSPSPYSSSQTLSKVPILAPMRLTPQVNEQCSPSTQEMNNISPLIQPLEHHLADCPSLLDQLKAPPVFPNMNKCSSLQNQLGSLSTGLLSHLKDPSQSSEEVQAPLF